MSLLKVIVFFLIISIAAVDSRTRRKRRQALLPSSYTGTYNGLGSNPLNRGYPLYGMGINGYPIGNNWYVSNNQGSANNNQLPYSLQQYPIASNYDYSSWSGNSGNDQSGQPYTGQSYVPMTNEWLPLPGVDRRKRSIENTLISKMRNNLVVSKDK